MNNPSFESLKPRLLKHLEELIHNRISEAEMAISATRESRDSDTKSTAGDKHEVGRAMIQIELDNQSAQLEKNKTLQKQLESIELDRSCEEVGFGNLVAMESGIYFLSIGLGQVSFDGETYYVISSASPIGQLMVGKKVGDEFQFNSKEFTIKSIS